MQKLENKVKSTTSDNQLCWNSSHTCFGQALGAGLGHSRPRHFSRPPLCSKDKKMSEVVFIHAA